MTLRHSVYYTSGPKNCTFSTFDITHHAKIFTGNVTTQFHLYKVPSRSKIVFYNICLRPQVQEEEEIMLHYIKKYCIII